VTSTVRERSAVALPPSPYKGLAPFDDSEADALLFFGRARERRIISANLKSQRLTILHGPSGVGKSSVLRAGVVHDLRLEAERDVERFGSAEHAVVYHAEWAVDPVAGLVSAVAAEVTRLLGGEFAPPPGDRLAEELARWTDRLAGTLYVVLDQFEEYFLYHGFGAEVGSFADEFARTIAAAELPVSFVISIREDALASLDAFKRLIPNLFGNLLRLEQLDYEAACEAIVRPLDAYNAVSGAQPPFAIEPECVGEVLDEVASGRVVIGESGRGTTARRKLPLAERRFETPYLQLVMRRLWDQEQLAHSTVLRNATLVELGGAERIVKTHLDAAMRRLSRRERNASVRAFRYLVTPSNTKIAYTVPDLAQYAGLRSKRLEALLERLSAPNLRILRTVTGPDEQRAYEIFHDTLAPAVLDWRARYRRRRWRRRVGLGVAAILMPFLILVMFFAIRDIVTGGGATSTPPGSALPAQLRTKIVAAARWGVAHAPQIHYVNGQGPQGLRWLNRRPYSLPLYLSSSSFVTWCYWVAGAPNPNGSAYSLAGAVYFGSMLAHMKHIPQRQARPGDVVVFGRNPGHHVAIVVQAGADPLLISHGQELGPILIRYSVETQFQPRGVTWLTIF
jgi:Novel STAND NTPase 1